MVRRELPVVPLVLVGLALALAAGLVRFNGTRLLLEAFDLDARTVVYATVAVRGASFLAGGVAVAALGYWVGARTDLRRRFLALAGLLFVVALVGQAVAVGVTLVAAPPADTLTQFAVSLATVVPIEAVRFAFAGLAGAGLAVFRGPDRPTPGTAEDGVRA